MGTFRYVNSGPPRMECFGDLELYNVVKGDTCYDIAQSRQTTVDGLYVANHGLKCDTLQAGSQICAPQAGFTVPVSMHLEEEKEGEGERPGIGGPRFQCWQIMCNPMAGGDEHCKAEGCGKGCSSRSSKCEG